MSAKKRVPKLRFRGFSGEWEDQKIEDISEIIGGGTPSTSIAEYWDGEIDWYSPTEIGNKTYADGSVKKITLLGLEKSSARVLPANKTILFTSRAGIGSVAILRKDGTTNQGFQSFIVKSDNDTYFMYSLSNKIKEYALKIASGSTFLEISGKQLSKISVCIPKKNEQTKIGNYFQNLDKLIEQKEKKYQKLGQLKKAILEKMFPKEGATTPEIRFKGFSGEWEEKNLGEIMDVTSVKRIHQSDWTDSGIRFLRARDIVSIYKNKKPSDYLYITEEKYIEYSLISGKVKKNDLLVTGVGTIGIPMLISNNKPLYFKDGNIIWFKNENKLDGNFLYYSYINNKIKSYINISAGTGTVGTYTIDSGKKTPIQYPIKNEQTKIGNYFQKLDKLIDLHLQELEKLKNIKKASLAKMFV